MTSDVSVKISKKNLEKVITALTGLKYHLLALSLQVEDSIGTVKRVIEATDVPQISSPAEGSHPT